MQKESAVEIELSLKKKARRRLVGAIALVLLMVILLPILLKDRTAIAPQEQVEITITDESGLPKIEAPQMETSQPTPNDFDSNVVSSEPSSPSVVISKPGEPTVQAEPATKPEADKPVQPEAMNPKKASLLKETPKLEAKPTAEQSRFFVQVGVFSDPNNVKQLQAKLTSIGYTSKTEKVSTSKGEKIRLKTQVFTSRNDAALALQKIKEAGLTGMVVSQ